jgi:hypothetical protein
MVSSALKASRAASSPPLTLVARMERPSTHSKLLSRIDVYFAMPFFALHWLIGGRRSYMVE